MRFEYLHIELSYKVSGMCAPSVVVVKHIRRKSSVLGTANKKKLLKFCLEKSEEAILYDNENM